jgi:hypothetical protein
VSDTRWALCALLGLSIAGAALGAGFGIGRAAADHLTMLWTARRAARKVDAEWRELGRRQAWRDANNDGDARF